MEIKQEFKLVGNLNFAGIEGASKPVINVLKLETWDEVDSVRCVMNKDSVGETRVNGWLFLGIDRI